MRLAMPRVMRRAVVVVDAGATVGQLDEQSLYYLRSRGIGEAQARGLLTYGFARDILERVELAPLREKLTLELLDRMPNAEQIREMVQ